MRCADGLVPVIRGDWSPACVGEATAERMQWHVVKAGDLPSGARVAKWFDNHTAAVSVTYDGRPLDIPEAVSHADEHGVAIGYEMVTGSSYHGVPVYSNPHDVDLIYLLTDLIPGGAGYFGHGHNHVDHDKMSYGEALESFQACFDAMVWMGLKPVAYAYPRNAGSEGETQQALEDAGFLSGRLLTTNPDRFHNIADDRTEPDNWFALQSLPMQSIHFESEDHGPCESCINDNGELEPVLDEALERTSWIILTYHNIGLPEGYGWYDMDEFRKDVESIAVRDFWVSPMNEITLYARERANAQVAVEVATDHPPPLIERIKITVSDGLDDAVFDQPLTVSFNQPADWKGAPFAVYQDGRRLGEFVFETERAMLSLEPNERPYVLSRIHGADHNGG